MFTFIYLSLSTLEVEFDVCLVWYGYFYLHNLVNYWYASSWTMTIPLMRKTFHYYMLKYYVIYYVVFKRWSSYLFVKMINTSIHIEYILWTLKLFDIRGSILHLTHCKKKNVSIWSLNFQNCLIGRSYSKLSNLCLDILWFLKKKKNWEFKHFVILKV